MFLRLRGEGSEWTQTTQSVRDRVVLRCSPAIRRAVSECALHAQVRILANANTITFLFFIYFVRLAAIRVNEAANARARDPSSVVRRPSPRANAALVDMAASPTGAALARAEAMDAEERHARAVARQLLGQLEARRAMALNSTTSASKTTAKTTAKTRPRDARDALAANDENASSSRATDAKAMDALRGRCARLTRERDEARRSRADLARKCERLLGRAKTQDVELHKLRRLLGTTRATRGAARRSAPAATRGDGSPEVVSFEYHVASLAAFEQKVESLIEEIERLRAADARRAREADARDRAALDLAEDDLERASPSPPSSPSSPSSPTRVPSRAYSPTLSPLDALLSRITVTERDATSRRDFGDSDDCG